jgi:hypothetical protein
MAAHAYNQEYLAGLETAVEAPVHRGPAPEGLPDDRQRLDPLGGHQVSATPSTSPSSGGTPSSFFMRNHAFSGMYVFQRYTIDPDTGKMTLRDGDDLGP